MRIIVLIKGHETWWRAILVHLLNFGFVRVRTLATRSCIQRMGEVCDRQALSGGFTGLLPYWNDCHILSVHQERQNATLTLNHLHSALQKKTRRGEKNEDQQLQGHIHYST